MKSVISFATCLRLSLFVFLVPITGVAFGDDGIVRMNPSWQPERAFAVGDGILFTQVFIYPHYTEQSYFTTTTPIAYCGNDESLTPVLDDIPRGISVVAVGDGAAHVVGGVSIELENEHQGRIYPTRLYTSSDGLNWITLPDAPEIMWKFPYHLFKAHGCLYLECSSLDLEDAYQQEGGIILEPGIVVSYWVALNLLHSSSMPVVYRSCDGGLTWTAMPNIPWHDIYDFGIPQYDAALNNTHYLRSVTDINNTLTSRAYLYYSGDGLGWHPKTIIPGALYQHVAGIAMSQGALFAHAVDSLGLYLPTLPYDEPTIWKTIDGEAWQAQSLQVPYPSMLVASDDILIASHVANPWTIPSSTGIYYSYDGAAWFFWADWPEDCAPNTFWTTPLIVSEDALYIRVNKHIQAWPWHDFELWRMPLTLFTEGPPRVTISRSLHQPTIATRFPVNFDIVWSKPVYGFSPGDITLDGFQYILTELRDKGDGTHYRLIVTGIAPGASGTVIAPTIPAGVALDAQSNSNEAASCVNAEVVLDLAAKVPAYRIYGIAALLLTLALLGAVRIKPLCLPQ